MATSTTASTVTLSTNQLLTASWFDSAGIPTLNRHNVLDYFSQRSNPFYDRTCNNEVLKMQGADPAQLVNMTGIEYMLLHVQEPILYVIRKVDRQTKDRVIPLATYYILGGTVYQCPDISSIINSRLLSTLHLANEAFSECISYSRYDPNRGYYWEFPDEAGQQGQKDTPSEAPARPEDPTDTQRRRVDSLLNDLMKKFPPKSFGKRDGGKPVVLGEVKQERRMPGGGTGSEVKDSGSGPANAGIKRQGSEGKLPDPKKKRTMP